MARCYICYGYSTVKNNMCDCKGDISYAHIDCIQEWIENSNQTYCTSCLKSYNIPYTYRIWYYVYRKYRLMIQIYENIDIWEIYKDISQRNIYSGPTWDEGG